MAMDFPTSPVVGQIVSLGGNQYIWDGVGWNILPQQAPAALSDLPPANPAVGQFWWRATNGQLYVYVNDGNSSQWVQAAGQGITPNLRETLYNGSFSGMTNAAGIIEVRNIGAYSDLFFTINAEGNNAVLLAQESGNNGTTWDTTAASYPVNQLYMIQSPSTIAGGTTTTANGFVLVPDMVSSSVAETNGHLAQFNKTQGTNGSGTYNGFTQSNGWKTATLGWFHTDAFAKNALRFLAGSAAAISGHLILEGVRG